MPVLVSVPKTDDVSATVISPSLVRALSPRTVSVPVCITPVRVLWTDPVTSMSPDVKVPLLSTLPTTCASPIVSVPVFVSEPCAPEAPSVNVPPSVRLPAFVKCLSVLVPVTLAVVLPLSMESVPDFMLIVSNAAEPTFLSVTLC